VVDGTKLVVFNSGTTSKSWFDLGLAAAAAEVWLIAEHQRNTVSWSIEQRASRSRTRPWTRTGPGVAAGRSHEADCNSYLTLAKCVLWAAG
jgi:hypothetical protein